MSFRKESIVAPRKTYIWLGGYIFLLFLTASTRDFGATSLVTHRFGLFAAAFVEPIWKLLFWLLPLFLYLKKVRGGSMVFLKLLPQQGSVKRSILCILGAIVIYGIQFWLKAPTLHAPLLSWDDWLNGIVLVGFIEETVFRGFLFQEFLQWFQREENGIQFETQSWVDRVSNWIPFYYASTISSAIFTLIHIPGWLETHVPLSLIVSTSFINCTFGYMMCFVLFFCGSLWPCIFLHSLNDALRSFFL